MVKFSKELEAQLIPEWRAKFVNYWLLKKDVKKIKNLRRIHSSSNYSPDLNTCSSIFGPVRRLALRISDRIGNNSSSSSCSVDRHRFHHEMNSKLHGVDDDEVGSPDDQIIISSSDHRRAEQIGGDDIVMEEEEMEERTTAAVAATEPEVEEENETELMHLFTEEDAVNQFFDRLDREFDKVNSFYKSKEAELVERGEALYKQLQILLDLKRIFSSSSGSGRKLRRKNSGFSFRGSSGMSSARMSDASSIDNASDTGGGGTEISSQSQAEEVITALERHGVSFTAGAGTATTNSGNKNNILKALKKVKGNSMIRVDIPASDRELPKTNNANNPVRTISTAMAMLWEDLVNNPSGRKDGVTEFINRKKIQRAEKMIRSAYVELYRGLGLLKTYSSLNMVGFTKILKKFDKVTSRQESPSYLRRVKGSHFISSDKVVRQMDEVESLFTQHFAENDRKKAMKFLRPQEQKDSHMLSFLVGLFTGCFVTLFMVYALLAHISGIFSPRSNNASSYMETVYPVFSMFALLSLHMFMYGCNLFMWEATRINYNFIFEFSPKTSLKHRDAFLICTSLMTTVVAAMVIHLLLKSSGFSPTQIDALPGLLLLAFLLLLICPLNILYRPTRFCFLRVIRNIVCSPFYKVMMVDFFMADQLTSQIPLLRHIETATCYFLAGSFKTHQFETCKSGKLYRELVYVISFSPYFWRAMQCSRRWFDGSNPNDLYNFGKYVSAMVAALVRVAYSQQPSTPLLIAVVVTSVIATIYQLYWDFVRDWGVLTPGSKNPYLRDNLVLKNRYVYYISIALNVVLRVAWVESVLGFKIGWVESRMLDFFLASVEVFRRGHWNFYRLENEHLNNVGKYRALKIVPLPFQ